MAYGPTGWTPNLPDDPPGTGTGYGPGSGSGGSGTDQVVNNSFDDPNGNVVPDDQTKPAFYYKNGVFSGWTWTTPAGPWLAVLG